jgi:hypothetical protein
MVCILQKTAGRNMKQEERKLQAAFVAWFRLQYPKKRRLLRASLNGAHLAPASGKAVKHLPESTRRGIAWKRLQEQGATPGEADLFLSIPSGDLCGLYIEMKAKRGTQEDDQKLFEADVVAEGYGYVMPRSLEEAIQAVRRYLETGEY